MTPLRTSLLLSALAALGAAPATAQDLYLGSRTTLVSESDFLDGTSNLVGACGGIVQSMTTLNDQVYIGDITGNVYRYDPATGFFGYAFTAANDALSLVAEGGDLLVGGSDNTILRYDPTTGQAKGTLTTSLPVRSMVVSNGELILGSISGLVQSGDPVTGGFQFWASCGNNINAMTTDGTDLWAADEGGNVWRFSVSTQSVVESFPVGSEGHAMALIGGDLVVGCDDGMVRRLAPHGGALKASFPASFPVDALAVNLAPEPGTTFCTGTVCPCGNDDDGNGCANSKGFGSGLVANGSTSVLADDFALTIYDLPVNVPGRFYMSPTAGQTPFGDGLLCTGGGGYPVLRLEFGLAGPHGILTMGPGLVDYAATHLGAGGQIFPGSTWYFQAWYRDPQGPCGQGFNTSAAYSVTFTP